MLRGGGVSGGMTSASCFIKNQLIFFLIGEERRRPTDGIAILEDIFSFVQEIKLGRNKQLISNLYPYLSGTVETRYSATFFFTAACGDISRAKTNVHPV
jgi:hypothetical protein